MKLAYKGQVHQCLYRDLSKIPNGFFELKITVTPKAEPTHNIALGFDVDELLHLKSEINRVLGERQTK